MKIIVFGASHGTGLQVIHQGLAAGHDITAVTRHPETISVQHPNLHLVKGDVLKPATIENTVRGQDAVICTVGIPRSEPTVLYSQGVANVISAMRAAQVRRLLCLSASGLEPGPRWQRVIARPLLWVMLKDMYTDLVRMETIVQNSDRDWTIVRPPRLTDDPPTGHYQTAINKHLSRGWKISRADLAAYMVVQANSHESSCGIVEIASR
jgi:putative NADH-flavin reductase